MVDALKEFDELLINLKQAFSSKSKSADKEFQWNLLKKLLVFLSYDGQIPSIVSTNYYNILSVLLDALTPTLFNGRYEEELYDNVFLKGVNHDSYMILVRRLSSCSPSFEQDKIINLLQKFLRGSNLSSLLLSQCISSKNWDLKVVAATKFWDELITLIVSLPERVANKTKGNMEKIFAPSFFIPLLTSAMMKVLGDLHETIVKCQDCSLEFLGRLIGRLCIVGHSGIVVKKLSFDLLKVSENDFIWRRISQNLISKMPHSLLAAFITDLLLIIPWYGYIDWIIGDAVIDNSGVNFIITEKLLFIHHFKESLILQNIIGYLASSSNRKHVFFKVFHALLEVWSDASTLKYQSFPQQNYIASALMICSGWLEKIDDKSQTKCYIDKVLFGVQIRIGNSEQSVRNLGMVVGESLVSALDPDAPKLEFEIPCSETLNELKDLRNIPNKPDEENLFIGELECFDEVEKETCKWDEPKSENIDTEVVEEIDSDDDLEPYDLSNDVPLEDVKRPLYLRDCMLGLIERDKPEWTEQCLKHAESLIRSNADVVSEIAAEMTKVLLHLEDNFSTPDFIGLRHRALISLAVLCPIQVANFLTSQFYEKDYNIRQRLDILEVLASASQELSQLKLKVADSKPQCSKLKFVESVEQGWIAIVDERVKAKTRIISQGPKKPAPVPEENKFSMIAGFFFFPLLEKYDRESKMFDLLGDDSYVLGRLLYSLGIIMYSANNIPLSRQMGSEFLKFLAAVRHSSDVFVRQGVIFALTTIFLSVPASILLSDLQDDAFESQRWLQGVIEEDSDIECQIRASKALGVFISILKQEMPQLRDINK